MVKIDAPVPLARVFCRENGPHLLALDTQGALWGLGDNNFGELARDSEGTFPKSGEIPLTPLRRVTEKHWRDVAVGVGFTVAIAENGTLWSWGNVPFGMPGYAARSNPGKPQQVDGLHRWVSVTAGYGLAAGLTADGAVYMWSGHTHADRGFHLKLTAERMFTGQLVALPTDSNDPHPSPTK
jgi:alpha-tubulin suppressor-like RCC1 family protein